MTWLEKTQESKKSNYKSNYYFFTASRQNIIDKQPRPSNDDMQEL